MTRDDDPRDATGRTQAARALERTNALLAAALEATPDGVLAVDDQGRVLSHNRRFLELWGIPEAQMAERDGRVAFEASVASLRDPEGFAEKLEAIHANPRAETFDVLELRDGRTFERASVPFHVEGQGSGRVYTFRDVTERLREEASRARLEDEMRQAQKMEAVGRLAGGIAHHFNNLLTVISGYAAFVRESLSEGDARAPDMLEIEHAAKRAATLTRQLLAFGRRQVLHPKLLDLNGVVIGMESMLGRILGEDVAIRTSLDEALCRIKADPGQLEQVIVNLAVNARDAMPSGGVLELATHDVMLEHATTGPDALPAGRYARLDVIDTGVGMDEATLRRAFEPFFTTKEVGKGTGLGLSTVYGIVRQSGGAIEVESTAGHGATFRVLLPAGEERGDPTQRGATRSMAPAGGERVLVVEDEDPVRRVLTKALVAAGYSVLEARDGLDALAVLERDGGTIDLCVTDVVMPRMSGIELADALRARHREARVLFVSGHVDVGASVRPLPSSAAFLQKPFRPTMLLRKVREVLDGG
jgi:PAS domain S-box-containing protein